MLCWTHMKHFFFSNKIFSFSAYFLFIVILQKSTTAAAVILLFIFFQKLFIYSKHFHFTKSLVLFFFLTIEEMLICKWLLFSTEMWGLMWWKSLVRYSVTHGLVMLWLSSWYCQFCDMSSYCILAGPNQNTGEAIVRDNTSSSDLWPCEISG